MEKGKLIYHEGEKPGKNAASKKNKENITNMPGYLWMIKYNDQTCQVQLT